MQLQNKIKSRNKIASTDVTGHYAISTRSDTDACCMVRHIMDTRIICHIFVNK